MNDFLHVTPSYMSCQFSSADCDPIGLFCGQNKRYEKTGTFSSREISFWFIQTACRQDGRLSKCLLFDGIEVGLLRLYAWL
jgi:hypothetical protein